jgi:hypothetical protein
MGSSARAGQDLIVLTARVRSQTDHRTNALEHLVTGGYFPATYLALGRHDGEIVVGVNISLKKCAASVLRHTSRYR